MSFTINCPSCGMSLTVPDDAAGQQGKCSGCGTLFPIEQPYAPPRPAAAPPIGWAQVSPGQIRLGEGLSRGFTLLHANLGTFVGIGAIYLGIQIAANVAAQVPFLGFVIALALGLVVTPCLMAGMYRASLRQHDGGVAEVGDLFAEFSAWLDLFLVTLISGLIAVGLMLPVLCLVGAVVFGVVAAAQGEPDPASIILLVVVGILILLPLAFAVQTVFMWAIPSLLDRRQGFWDAITTSWSLVKTNFWSCLGAFIICGLLGGVGVLACCVGLIYTMPASVCCLAAIYRTAVPPPPLVTAVSAYGMPPPAAWPPASAPPSPPAAPGPPPIA